MLAVVVISGFILALAAPWLARRWPSGAGWVLALLPLAQSVYFATLMSRASSGGEALVFDRAWSAELGLRLSLRADGLGLLFALLISGIGALVTLYGGGYLKGNRDLGRFYAWLFVFMSAMLGVALSDDLILLFVFWELTSLSSFMLIGFKHDYEGSRTAAVQALLVTGLGGLAMLAGFVLLGQAGGTYRISALLTSGEVLRASPLYLPALLLVLAGAFTKSAQFPFHFWLPNAMEAPTPVSAYLHSATMVKAGVYLLARLHPALGGTPAWQALVAGVGAASMLAGAYLALSQTDLKRLLAYSTISALGTMTLLIGVGGDLALKAAVVFLAAHALYKGALFMVAGAVDHEAGRRDVRRLGGLGRRMPFTAAAAGLAALSMAGLPPLLGFIAKEILYETALVLGPWVSAAVIFAALSNVFVAGMAALAPFWGRVPLDEADELHAHEAPPDMTLGPLALALLGLLAGLLAGPAGRLLEPAVTAAGGSAPLKLALWHGLNLALGLSLLTVLAGLGLYALRRPLRGLLEKVANVPGPEQVYKAALKGLVAVANAQTRFFQNGYLRYYMTTIILATVLGSGLALFGRGGWHWPAQVLDLRFYEVALAVFILIAAVNAARSTSRLSAVASMGAAGYGVALLYLLYGAPDLAMTQFLVESLTVILFVLAFYHLPHFARLSTTRARLRDVLVSLLVGGLMAALVLSSLGGRAFPAISEFFAENAYTLAHGRNVVNVILVDFRAMDTLGEITVLGVAAAGVYALLKLRARKDRPGGKP